MTSGLPSPNGARRSSSCGEAEREVVGRDDRVDASTVWKSRPRSATGVRLIARTPPRTTRCSFRRSRGPPPPDDLRSARGARRRRRARRAGRRSGSIGPIPSSRPGLRDQDDGPAEALDETGGDDPDHALVPVLVPEDVAAAATLRLGHRLDTLRDASRGSGPRPPGARGSAPRARRRAGAPRSASSVRTSSSATSGRPRRPAALIRGASRKPMAPASTAAGSTRALLHQRLQARTSREASVWRPAAASARFSSRSGTTSAIVARATRSRSLRTSGMVGAEERLAELVDDSRAAELRERVLRGTRRDHGAVGKRLAGPVVVGDDHVETEPRRLRDLVDGSDPAVHGQDEADALLGESRERVARDAVPLVEPARQVPDDVGAELRGRGPRARSRRSRRRRSRRGRRSSCRRRPPRECLDGRRHVAEQERVVIRERRRRESGARPPDCRSRAVRGPTRSPRSAQLARASARDATPVERLDRP